MLRISGTDRRYEGYVGELPGPYDTEVPARHRDMKSSTPKALSSQPNGFFFLRRVQAQHEEYLPKIVIGNTASKGYCCQAEILQRLFLESPL